MATTTTTTPRLADTVPAPPRARGNDAVKVWAAVGAVAVAVIVTGLVRWVFSDDFEATPKGPDHYDHLTLLRIVEVASALFLLYFFVTCVVLPLVRDRRLGFDGKLLIGCLAVHFIDPVFNYYSPTFLQNAYAVNQGSWANFIPGYASASGDAGFVEGVLWAAALYGLFGVAAAKMGCWLLVRMRRRRPGIGNIAAYSLLFAIFAVGDFVVENFFVRNEIYIFWGAWSDFTLWSGHVYQFPLYETLLAVIYALGFVWLRDSRDDTGRSFVERGTDQLRVGQRARSAVSFLAITGFSLAWAVGSYFGPFVYTSMQADSFPKLPSYLQGGAFCGIEGRPACPPQDLRRTNERVTRPVESPR